MHVKPIKKVKYWHSNSNRQQLQLNLDTCNRHYLKNIQNKSFLYTGIMKKIYDESWQVYGYWYTEQIWFNNMLANELMKGLWRCLNEMMWKQRSCDTVFEGGDTWSPTVTLMLTGCVSGGRSSLGPCGPGMSPAPT